MSKKTKKCSVCGEQRPAKEFLKWSCWCRKCKNFKQRELRAKNSNKHTKKYEKTPRGFLMRTYRNMTSRVKGIQHKKAHLYEGLEILPRETFYTWAWSNVDFWRLYKDWQATGFLDRRLTPSINRVDPELGYIAGNIEWITHSVNSTLGCKSSKRSHKKAVMEVYNHVTA